MTSRRRVGPLAITLRGVGSYVDSEIMARSALCQLCHYSVMAPKLLSQWADENGIPRRTAYNWAKSGKLNVALHRTLTGRLVVLDDVASEDRDAHPFVAAYAEALGLPISTCERHVNHSQVLEAWGTSLYNAVTEDLRPAVLQLAVAAACGRTKADVATRFSDWIG